MCVCVRASTAPGVCVRACVHCSRCVCVCVCVCASTAPDVCVCVRACVRPLLQVCVCSWMGQIQRTHFTADYTLYNYVCDKKKIK